MNSKTEELKENQKLILMGYRGSIAHGTNIDPELHPDNATDDIDVMGIYIAPPEFYYGRDRTDTIESFVGPYDIVLYEIRKYLKLCANFNPNAISLLYTKPDHIFWRTGAGEQLQSLREVLLSKKAYHSFKGYAHSQLKQMEHHTYNGYESSKRQELLDKFGYDVKHASHLIRLLRMGCEILEQGHVFIYRGDRPYLKSIKLGRESYKSVLEEAKRLFDRLDRAVKTTHLPEEPNYESIDKVGMQIIHGHMEECMWVEAWRDMQAELMFGDQARSMKEKENERSMFR